MQSHKISKKKLDSIYLQIFFLQEKFAIKQNLQLEENTIQIESMNQLMTFCLPRVVKMYNTHYDLTC